MGIVIGSGGPRSISFDGRIGSVFERLTKTQGVIVTCTIKELLKPVRLLVFLTLTS
jgi:hypothetical protein